MKKTLVILAAGMGSRFGGVKQIEPVGPSGEIISDYNVYNAIKYGFTKVVFIIRRHHLDVFKNDITQKFKDKIEVEFAFQEFDTIKSDIAIPETREKVLGTAHALLCAKDVVDSSFALINADDFYGEDAFKKASEFIDNNTLEYDYLNVTYPVRLVTNELLPVKRGICYNENGLIKRLIESEVIKKDGKYIARELESELEFLVDENKGCSMNFFVFKESVFSLLEVFYNNFLKTINDKNESLLPECISLNIENNTIRLHEKLSESNWYGITYKEELNEFKKEINKLIEKKDYPKNLWG